MNDEKQTFEGRDIGKAELDSWLIWRDTFSKGSEDEDPESKALRLSCLEEAENAIAYLTQEGR